MHTVFALLCFVVVIHWLICPYPTGLLHWHCGNLTIAPVPAKQPWWIWINTSCEFVMNDFITTTKQSTTKPCAYFLGYTVRVCVFVCAGRRVQDNFKSWNRCPLYIQHRNGLPNNVRNEHFLYVISCLRHDAAAFWIYGKINMCFMLGAIICVLFVCG